MPRSASTSVEANFSRGLITEATAMNYPENSVVEADNCVFLKNGSVLRRNGIDFETASKYTFASLNVLSHTGTPNYSNVAVNEYEWNTLGENSSKSFLVSQIGDRISFYEINNTNTISPNKKNFQVYLNSYRTTPGSDTDIASVTGTTTVDETFIDSLDGTFTITVAGNTRTLTFVSPGAGGIESLAEFGTAINTIITDLDLDLSLTPGLNRFRIAAPANDITTSFTIGGTGGVPAAFGIATGTYNPDVGDAFEAVARRPAAFSQGLGYLFIVHPFCEPVFVEYNDATDTITTTAISVQTRDFERIYDGYPLDSRKNDAIMGPVQIYNLYNQGWYAAGIKTKELTPGSDDGPQAQVASHWRNVRGFWPSNTDVWWSFKNASDRYDPSIETTALLSTPAPNGHYIYSAFQTRRYQTTGFNVPEKSSGAYRPSTTAFFASRVWYAGVNVDGFTSNIYFSKLIEDKQDFGKCYQANDPTSEELYDLNETDGGVIVIPDIVKITGMMPIGRSLLIFATNGIWAIGGAGGGFRANEYAVQKIGSSPVDAQLSIVNAENKPFWWSRSGIYTIMSDPNSGELTVENISDNTIKRFIQQVPAANVESIKGVYNPNDKTIQWLYRTLSAVEEIQKYQYNNILVHDLASQAFYPHEVAFNGDTWISGAISSTKSSYDTLSQDDGGSTISYMLTGLFGTANRSFSIGKFKNKNYVDWPTVSGGTAFESSFITGYRVRAELLRKFQSNYVVVMARNLYPTVSGALMYGIWDWDTPGSGLSTIGQQIYNVTSTTIDYIRRKLKIRGNGYSLQFKFKSQPNKPFNIVGWVVSESAGQVP